MQKQMRFSLLLLMLFGTGSSLAAVVSGNWDIKNMTGSEAKDFHVTITPGVTAGRSRITDHYDGPFGRFDSETDGYGRNTTLKWDQGSVPSSDNLVHVGVEIDSKVNSIQILDAFWTDGNGDQIGDSIKLPGFKAGKLSPLEFILFNDFDAAITIQDLQFKISDVATALDLMIPFTLGGFGPSQTEFTLLPGEQMEFGSTTISGSGDFLLAQFRSFPTSDPSNEALVMYQHEVPNASTLFLLLSGGVGLIGWKRTRLSKEMAANRKIGPKKAGKMLARCEEWVSVRMGQNPIIKGLDIGVPKGK
jgi:hypothetical protein